eukprot:15273192-Heterocapsa_arctica.AAC.1
MATCIAPCEVQRRRVAGAKRPWFARKSRRRLLRRPPRQQRRRLPRRPPPEGDAQRACRSPWKA